MSESLIGSWAGDRIRLTGIGATGYHGVLPHERRDGQQFSADVELHVDTRRAAEQDRLDLTVDYGALAEEVAAVLAGEPVDLIETVAERIAALAMDDERVRAVDVVVHKPQAPVTVPVVDVSVAIHRDRAHLPVVQAPRGGLATTPGLPPPVFPVVAPAAFHEPELPAPAFPMVAPAFPPVGPVVPFSELIAPTAFAPAATVPGLAPAAPVLEAAPAPALAEAASDAQRDRLDLAPDGEADVVLALGSNVGASQDTLRQAVNDLAAVEGLQIVAIGPLARTAPVGGPDQSDFLNTVLLARTRLSPRALLHACQRVEERHGRVRDEPWAPRTLDVDVITFGTVVAVADDLELPHPRANQRAFVLQPWSHLDPEAMLPGLGGGPVAALAQTAPDAAGIRWMALDWWGTEARP